MSLKTPDIIILGDIVQYFVGSFITFIGMFVFFAFMSTVQTINKPKKHRYSQSHIHTLVKPLLPPMSSLKKELVTQSSKHLQNVQIKVIILGPDAFWIKDNVLYTAKITQDGVDKNTTIPVDTMGMDKVELDKMIFIVDQLQNGQKHDTGSSGD